MTLKSIGFAGLAVMLGLWGGVASAQSAEGMWRTQTDDRGQRAIVSARPCGADALCGTIVQVLDPSLRAIEHPNIGVQLFWDMVPTGKGLYAGRAFVPAMKAKTKATMQVVGQEMKVKGCIGPICKSQIWTRVP